jgi:hypothetical protein
MPDIEDTVRQAFELGCEGGEQATYRLIEGLVVAGHPAAEISACMERVDPDRLVWDHAARPGETGTRGWPLLQARYAVCSDPYGHRIDVPEGARATPRPGDVGDPMGVHAFFRACEERFDDGTFHDCGHVVMDRRDGQLGFLVTVPLDPEDLAAEEDLAAVGAAHGVTVEGMAYPDLHGKPGTALVTAFLDETRLGLAGDVARDIADATRRRGPSPR